MAAATTTPAGLELRAEPVHDEAFIRALSKDLAWPALLPAVDALEAWTRAQGREPRRVVRQVLTADQRTAGPHAGLRPDRAAALRRPAAVLGLRPSV